MMKHWGKQLWHLQEREKLGYHSDLEKRAKMIEVTLPAVAPSHVVRPTAKGRVLKELSTLSDLSDVAASNVSAPQEIAMLTKEIQKIDRQFQTGSDSKTFL